MDTRNQSSNINYLQDIAISGFDTTFWKTLAGASDPSIVSSKIRLNATAIASLASFKYGDVAFAINVPVKPTAGDVRKWGFYSPSLGDGGSIFFDITDDVFTVNAYDDDGTVLFSKEVTWNDVSWSAAEIVYRIRWDRDVVEFLVDGTKVGSYRVDPTIQHTLTNYSLPIYINNANADNADIGFVQILGARFIGTPQSVGSGVPVDVSVTADTEFPAASALADADANPTTTRVGANLLIWNGTTWDRAQSSDFGSGGGAGGGGDNTYSTEQGDFTATITDATNDVVLSVDSVGGSAITVANFANAILKVWDATDEEMKTITLDDFTWTSATKTLAVANCTGSFTFNTGDIVSLTMIGPDKKTDTSADSGKSIEQAPLYTRYAGDTLVNGATLAANATAYAYLDMAGYRNFAFQCDVTTGTDTLTLTVEATWEDNGTAQASCDYVDVTNDWFGVASVVDLDTTFEKDTPCSARFVRLKYVTSNTGGGDVVFTVHGRRTY